MYDPPDAHAPVSHMSMLGRLVRDIWQHLHRCQLVSAESISSAMLRGMMPYFFEQKVIELERVAPDDRLPGQLRASAGTGFCLIEWDIEKLVKIARAAINGADNGESVEQDQEVPLVPREAHVDVNAEMGETESMDCEHNADAPDAQSSPVRLLT